jgi:Ca2+-transporting ATPase
LRNRREKEERKMANANEFYSKSIDEVLDFTDSSKKGLTADEASKRLAENGKNELEGTKKVPAWLRFAKQLKHIMMLVLIFAMILKFEFPHFFN